MKTMRKLFLILSIYILGSFTAPVNEIVNALSTGSSNRLSRYFDNYIELTIQDRTASYSKGQAEMIVRDFFSTNNVKSYSSINFTSNSSWQSYLGTLYTNNGNYQISIFSKLVGGKQLIQRLSFDK
jgi:hypothetical protein